LGVVIIGTNIYDALAVGMPDRGTYEELVPMSRRPLAALISVVLSVLGVVFVFPPDCASACMCAIEGSQKERAKRAISHSDAVFSGDVVGFEKLEKPPSRTTMTEETMFLIPAPRDAIATLRVSEVWKGPKQHTVRLTTITPFTAGGSCAHHFEEGREYLVYANRRQDSLRVDDCSETKLLSNAGADLALLGNSGEKPKDGDGEVLSDTSGDFSGPALAGLAGLALAASFFAVVRLVRTG
jgi:hypothetical protein